MAAFSLEPFVPRPVGAAHDPAARHHQGIPGIEILPSGRMFATWYGGELAGEGPGNYVPLSTSADGGRSWREVQVIAPPPGAERAYDPALWLDPKGRLWWFWSQSVSAGLWKIHDGRAGVFAVVCDAPDTDSPVWSAPRRLCDGVMMNKPAVLADGSWALPAALWGYEGAVMAAEATDPALSNVLVTADEGETFTLVAGPDVPQRLFDEHVLVERRDGSWWVLVRTQYGIGESVSRDRGRTWSQPRDSGLGGPCSRFALRRLASGRLLFINHQAPLALPGEPAPPRLRDKLTAWLSDDDGATWRGRLMIDERAGVSYPDFAEGADGFIYAVYDHERMRQGQVLLARFTEADVLAGSMVTPGAYTRLVVSAFPQPR